MEAASVSSAQSLRSSNSVLHTSLHEEINPSLLYIQILMRRLMTAVVYLVGQDLIVILWRTNALITHVRMGVAASSTLLAILYACAASTSQAYSKCSYN